MPTDKDPHVQATPEGQSSGTQESDTAIDKIDFSTFIIPTNPENASAEEYCRSISGLSADDRDSLVRAIFWMNRHVSGFYPFLTDTAHDSTLVQKRFNSLNVVLRQLYMDKHFTDDFPAESAIREFIESRATDVGYWHACEWVRLTCGRLVSKKLIKEDDWDFLEDKIIQQGKAYEGGRPLHLLGPVGRERMIDSGKKALLKIHQTRKSAKTQAVAMKDTRDRFFEELESPDQLEWTYRQERSAILYTFDQLKSDLKLGIPLLEEQK
ncbi:uncharacterized protein JN550_007545 [Neoarthrinium moseri]|uniref:uncharacterized protein n=1 Tax=Neoarthrinium moseri TaxID=1658444 RepID=UPI001FDE2F99|nr:uncharacterized protein JN550_007545 [Neoarthrinium moseri]KAI1866692.1 hypothetical protein JN550_007545 [Neoarthrinium moseri]